VVEDDQIQEHHAQGEESGKRGDKKGKVVRGWQQRKLENNGEDCNTIGKGYLWQKYL
jgi:hypothetical protein